MQMTSQRVSLSPVFSPEIHGYLPAVDVLLYLQTLARQEQNVVLF